MVALVNTYSSNNQLVIIIFSLSELKLTLRRPGELLVLVHSRLRRVNLEPDAARTIPVRGTLALGDFG